MLQIGHLLDRRPSQLSGGQRQRVAMGRALVRDPRVFLFDEPLSNLDAKLRVDMRTEIKKLHGATGKTIVYVTHDQIEAMTLGSKIAVLRDGALQQVGTPAAAMLEVARENETAIALRVPPTVQQTRLAAGQEVILGIRPEAITEPSAVDRTSTLVDVVEALVEVVEPAGSDTYVVMRAAEKEVIARMRADADVRPGTRIPFAFDLAKAVVFDKAGGQRLA
jgi:multiple sugar transport system ATP-binding protein